MINSLNKLALLSTLSMTIIFSSSTLASDVDTVIENTAAVMAAGPLCNLEVDLNQVQLVFNAFGISAEQFSPGGVYYQDMERHKRRIENLVMTDDGLNSFCWRTKTDLSAMFK